MCIAPAMQYGSRTERSPGALGRARICRYDVYENPVAHSLLYFQLLADKPDRWVIGKQMGIEDIFGVIFCFEAA